MACSWVSRFAVAIAASQSLISHVAAQVPSQILSQSPSSDSRLATAAIIPIPSITSSSSTPIRSRGPQVYTVTAGAGGFKFTPQQISNVSVGDTITFEFYPPDHSVARAEFGSACVPYEYTGRNKTGFWSTTQLVKTVSDITHWNLTINSTEPIFFYCAAPKSCIGEHMVGVINPNSTQTLDAQIAAAKVADFQVAPGDPIPNEATSTLSVPSPSATASAAPPPPAQPSSSHKLSAGVIAGIVVGAVAFLVLCAALFFFVGRSKSLKEVIKRQDATVKSTSTDPHMSQYGTGGLHSPGFAPVGHSTPTRAFSPAPHGQETYFNGAGGLPPQYGQHNVGEQYPSGWASPPLAQGQGQGQHLSRFSETSGLSQAQIDEMKYAQANNQPVLAELQSPTPGQGDFASELEAPPPKVQK